MIRPFKITFLLVVAFTMCTTATATKNKTINNGFFYYEGQIDKNSMVPRGEGTLYLPSNPQPIGFSGILLAN